MSAAPTFDPDEVLSGLWTDITIVENAGETDETETFLAHTTQPVSVTKNTDTDWSATPNSSRYTQSGDGHVSREIEVTLLQDADSDLEAAGVVDTEDNDEIFNSIHDAVRLYVFQEREDADGEQVIEREAKRCRISWGDEEYPDDPATVTLTITVMGEYLTAHSAAA